tara:strand:- start:634 stop:1290 length:657 start_codon:yes stop_codon:yes gene_type:complete
MSELIEPVPIVMNKREVAKKEKDELHTKRISDLVSSCFDSCHISQDKDLIAYIKENNEDPWKGTPYQGYVFMDPKQKGEYGERFVSKMLESIGMDVKRAPTATDGHDRVVNEKRVEIKFSVTQKDKKGGTKNGVWIMNHVATNKDWERLIFVGVLSHEKIIACWFTKEDFVNHLQCSECCFKRQQSGKDGGNNDYICTDKSLLTFIELPFVHKNFNDW